METLSKARVKLIQSLQHKKFRLKYDKFIVEGLKIVHELSVRHPGSIEEILITDPAHVAYFHSERASCPVHLISPVQMHQLSQMSTPPGVLAVCHLPPAAFLPEQLEGKRIFYLDAIRDPGNLGTILRIADWFGIDIVVLSPDCVDIYNHKVLQSSMGSALTVASVIMEKSELMLRPDVKLYACDLDGDSIDDAAPPASGVMILGNESLGVSDDFQHQVDRIYTVPGASERKAESLNVAVAASVMAYWWTKGRR